MSMKSIRVGLALATLGAGCATLGLREPGNADAPEVVDVVMSDSSIEVRPHLVARGKVGFELVNEGLLEHGFRIVGPGVDEQSDGLVVPGQPRRVWVKLGVGTFRIFCPDGNHADLGMSAQLDVTDEVNQFRR
jgi:uncharacterized cupredoxin-like copper-binding protein